MTTPIKNKADFSQLSRGIYNSLRRSAWEVNPNVEITELSHDELKVFFEGYDFMKTRGCGEKKAKEMTNWIYGVTKSISTRKRKKVVASVSDIDEARLRLMCEKYDFTSMSQILEYLVHCFLRVADPENDSIKEPMPIEIKEMFSGVGEKALKITCEMNVIIKK